VSRTVAADRRPGFRPARRPRVSSDQGATDVLFARPDDGVPACIRVFRDALILDVDGFATPIFSADADRSGQLAVTNAPGNAYREDRPGGATTARERVEKFLSLTTELSCAACISSSRIWMRSSRRRPARSAASSATQATGRQVESGVGLADSAGAGVRRRRLTIGLA
jgi:hypothetical protein